MPTDKTVNTLIINTLTEEQYQAIENPSDEQLWVTPYDESVLPDQTGQSGKFLTTDGTAASWAAVDTLPSQSGQSGKFLTTDGTDSSWSDVPAPSVMTGATSGAAGTSGLVPAPAAGDQAKYLTGAGTWEQPSGLQNTATGLNSLTILGTANTYTNSTNIGPSSVVYSSYSTAIGMSATCYGKETTAIGTVAQTNGQGAVAIGYNAKANAQNAIQIGTGTNSTASSVQIGTYQLFDRSTGKLIADRLGTGYNATKTQVLKNVNGTLTWVDEA